MNEEEQIPQLYQSMYSQLCIYAMNSLQDWHLAEEAVQDTFRIACAKPESLLNSENPRGWLTITLKNVIQNVSRRRARMTNLMVELAAAAGTPSSEGQKAECDLLYSDLRERKTTGC